MRLWKEFWNPALKCKRVGHKTVQRRFKAIVAKDYEESSVFAVADTATVTRTVCKRCCRKFGKDKITNREAVHSLSMPTEEYDHFKETGVKIQYEI